MVEPIFVTVVCLLHYKAKGCAVELNLKATFEIKRGALKWECNNNLLLEENLFNKLKISNQSNKDDTDC